MKKFLLSILAAVSAVSMMGQTCPTPSSTGVHITLDSTYQLGTYRVGKTDVGLCFYNSSSENITATQFRVFYDKQAFQKVDTITSTNTSFSQYMQYVDNPTGGYVTITITYTGTNSSFSIPNGALFKVTFKHNTALATTYFAVTDMTFNGSSSFGQTATNQVGSDYTLNLTNFGGVFKPQTMSYKGKFVNVTGTPSKQIAVALEKKLKTSSSWSQVTTRSSNTDGRWEFKNIEIDTTAWDVRIAVKGDTMSIGNVISTADAQRVNQYVLGQQTPTGFDFYASDVNGDNKITISDVYGVYARVSGRFTTWANSVKDVKFFTSTEYTNINGSTSNLTGTYAGSTNFTFDIVAGQPDSVTYYVVVPGDANGTGFKRARLVPIEIVNPNNANRHIIDVTTVYDNQVESIELNYPKLGVDEGDFVNIPVVVKTPGFKVGALQLSMKYDNQLLEFIGVKNELNAGYWMSFINTQDNEIEWGGFDVSSNNHLISNQEKVFTLQFKSLKPQADWNKSPLYVTRKFGGNDLATDLGITPTDGIVQVFRVRPVGVTPIGGLGVFPNPLTEDLVIIYRVYEYGLVDMYLTDFTGRKLQQIVSENKEVGEYFTQIDFRKYSPGLYMVISTNGGKTSSEKVSKVD
jgi:hypothetical protein